MKTKQSRRGQTRLALHFLLPYLKRQLPRIFLTLILAVAAVTLTLLVPIFLGDAIDIIVGVDNVDTVGIILILARVAICVAATAVLQWFISICNNAVAFQIVRDLRLDAFEKIEHLPLSYLDSHPAGEIVSRVIADADVISDGLLMGFTQLFTGVLTIAGTLGILLWINPWIALCVVVLTPLSLFVASFIARRTYAMFRLQSETRGEQTAFIDEMISGQKVVQAFSHRDENEEKFDEINERLRRHSLRSTFFSSLTNPSTRAINNLVYAVVALMGALMIINPGGIWNAGSADLTVGALFSCLSYANQYTKPFNEISGVVTELQNAFACTNRLSELILQPAEAPDAPNALTPEHLRGEINISHVSFSYVPERPLMLDMNLQVKPGMRIAIVGPTGCGKTTLINLLMRFYDVTGGSISADGTDIRLLTREGLRRNIGMVLQDTWIRRGTVRENIAMGKPSATTDEIVAAAKSAHADGFIRRLPQGYDTVLSGDAGLSAGQRQLLCIARIMLTHPAMLILDEATSSIDTRTERKIQDAFEHLMDGRTTFIVAHRLSTIVGADKILVMKDGNVIETGSHKELLAKGGFYTTLYNSQFEP